MLVSCPRNSRYIAGGQLAVFQGAGRPQLGAQVKKLILSTPPPFGDLQIVDDKIFALKFDPAKQQKFLVLVPSLDKEIAPDGASPTILLCQVRLARRVRGERGRLLAALNRFADFLDRKAPAAMTHPAIQNEPNRPRKNTKIGVRGGGDRPNRFPTNCYESHRKTGRT